MAEKQHKSERLMAGTLGHAVGEATRAAVSAATEAALEKEYIERSYLEDVSALLGGRMVLGSMIESDLEAHELLHRGLPRAALSSLVEKLHVIHVDEASEALGDERSDPPAPQVRAGRALRRAAKRTRVEVR